MRLSKKHSRTRGQALVEFAIIAVGLLMLIFLIIEAARILWAWGTVQNAARSGARYAITGNFETDCASQQDLGKYSDLCSDLDLRRPASIINATHQNLAGLPLNEDINSVFEDSEFYTIEVYGVDQLGQLKGTNLPAPYGPAPFAGSPNRPVVVRVTYRVPIITPFFSPILPSIPVFGQTTLYNEPFGQLGGTGQSAGAPPPIPALPTPGVTPSFTPTPTPGASSTFTPMPTNTATATRESCPIRWTSSLVADIGLASVTGIYNNNGSNYVVLFYNLTNDPGEVTPIGSATMLNDTGNVHACPGIGNTTLALTSANSGNTIRVRHPDGTYADIIVQGEPDTPTPTPSNTPTATIGPTTTNTPTATATPRGPFIAVQPSSCAVAPSTNIFITGVNWPTNQSISIYLNGNIREQILASEHNGTFNKSWVQAIQDGHTYQILVVASGGTQATHTIIVPCPNITPTPILVAPTNTPIPADLTIGKPILISTPPIVEYRSVQFQVPITNSGEVDVNSQFFVDIFIDPPNVYPQYIPIPPNPAYSAVGSIPGGSSKVITITSETGFTGGASVRQVYGMVDSLRSITEGNEGNNISEWLQVTVIPADTPQPTPTPDGNSVISGRVRFLISNWIPQERARVFLTNNQTGVTIASETTDASGNFEFDNISVATNGYKVTACFYIDNQVYVGSIPSMNPPNNFALIFLSSTEPVCPISY